MESRKRTMRSRSLIIVAKKSLAYLTLLICVFVSLFPIYWVVITSFKAPAELSRTPPTFFVMNIDFEIYPYMFESRHFGSLITNSIIVSLATSAVCVTLGTFIAYALTPRLKLSKKVRTNVSTYILSLRMFPPMVMVIPFFAIFQTLHLLDNLLALIISYSSFNLPFVVWVMRGFLEEMPGEIEEAAMIDGLTRFRAFLRITVPIVVPAILTVAVFTFIFSWQEFLYALILSNTYRSQTATIGVFASVSKYEQFWNKIASAGVMSAAPIIIFIMIVRKYIVRGMTFGLVKG